VTDAGADEPLERAVDITTDIWGIDDSQVSLESTQFTRRRPW